MPLKEGSSDKVIQENIKALIDGDAGYDPPYKDKSRSEYTPQQAAAIAYAKAGKRKSDSKKKDAPEAKKKESHDSSEVTGIAVPEGWNVSKGS